MTGPGVTFGAYMRTTPTSCNRAQGVQSIGRRAPSDIGPLARPRAAREPATLVQGSPARTGADANFFAECPTETVRASRHAGMPKAFHRYEPPQS